MPNLCILYRPLIFLSLLLSPAGAAQAAHIIGGEVTYECLGWTGGDPNSGTRAYQFYMNIYRDCQGGGAAFDSAPGAAFNATATVFRASDDEPLMIINLGSPTINFVDPEVGNPCIIVPSNVCVQQGVYTFPILDLPVLDESYYITYQRCCRNNTITNIIDPGGSGATYSIELTAAAQAVCNNSPTYNFFPPPVICASEPLNFDHSATDEDGDQLVYEFCAPFLGGGLNFDFPFEEDGLAPNPESRPPYEPVDFLSPFYTPTKPLGVTTDIAIDVNSGLITGTPLDLGQFVVGVCVSEFRNGELLSVVRRDFQFNVTTCDPVVRADIAEDNAVGADLYISQCANRNVFIINESFDQAFIDEYRWEFDLGGGRDTVLSTWNALLDFPEYGTFPGRLLLNPGSECGDTANIIVELFPEINADFSSSYDTCVAGPVQFTPEIEAGAAVVNYAWDFGNGDGSSNEAPNYKFAEAGTKLVRLRAIDENGCRDSTIKAIDYFPVPALILVSPNTFEGCAPASIFFDNLSEPVNTSYTTFWDFGDGGTSNDISPTHVFTKEGVFDVQLEITSPIGCVTDTIFPALIRVEPAPVANFTFSPDRPDNFNPEVVFTDLSTGVDQWFWQLEGPVTSTLQHPTHVFRDTGRQEVRLVATHPLGCQDTAVQVVDIRPQTTFFLPNAFTPNDDGLNDVYKGKGFLRGYSGFELLIWNRWGEVVFSSTDPQEGWDGKFSNSGQPAPQGSYLARLTYTGPRGEPVRIQSTVTLIR
ncbi:PKD domain-containing protein [Phaeodactylibacter luteus]|uniref:PKD domain-containing protein n=1 Tax=Phaeodactylibacter luteus TaxID=1564516 RepID=A0A5C6RN92_9BACT|nr:PKD domain-containing protein [Phaeodactylibacter luteus]TXB63110.1 PKD domain-containing protein [Phaeodactylibacter luteus]